MKSRILTLLCLIASFTVPAFSQSAPPAQPVTQQWSLTTSAVALPGGKTSIAGTDSGISFTPSANFDIFDRNLLSNDGSLKYFAGGVTYRLPIISTKLNNMASNTDFLRFQFAPTASFGIAQVNGVNHYGFTAGARVDYMLNASGSWTFGGKGEYAHFPGYDGKAIVELNAAFHF